MVWKTLHSSMPHFPRLVRITAFSQTGGSLLPTFTHEGLVMHTFGRGYGLLAPGMSTPGHSPSKKEMSTGLHMAHVNVVRVSILWYLLRESCACTGRKTESSALATNAYR